MDRIPTVAPRLTTDRLVLRQLETRDFESFAQQLMDPIAMEPLKPVPDRRTAWQRLASMNGMWTLTGGGWWGIELRATGALVGTVGAFFRETIVQNGADEDLEIGWTVFTGHRRRGIAVEAARAALADGWMRHRVKRTVAYVDVDNVASSGVCIALGMSVEAEVDFYGSRCRRYVVTRLPTAEPARSGSSGNR